VQLLLLVADVLSCMAYRDVSSEICMNVCDCVDVYAGSARGVLLVKPIDDDNAWMTPNVNNTTATTTTTTSTTTTLLIDEALPDDVEEDEDDANSTFNVDTTISTNSNNDDMRDNVTQSAKRRKA
jgi:hypothetical protein